MSEKLMKYAINGRRGAQSRRSINLFDLLRTLANVQGTWQESHAWKALVEHINCPHPKGYNGHLPRQLRKAWVLQALRNYAFNRANGGLPDFLRVKERIAPGSFTPRGQIVTRMMPRVNAHRGSWAY